MALQRLSAAAYLGRYTKVLSKDEDEPNEYRQRDRSKTGNFEHAT